MLSIENISKSFNKDTPNEKRVINNLTLRLCEGDFFTIIGSNGAGKSTLMNLIAGSIAVDSGKIFLDNKDITNLKDYKRAKYIGRLFQDPMKSTAPNMTILENLGLAYSRGKRNIFSWAIKKKDIEFFRQELAKLDMGLEDRLHTKVKLLSGGQRQALTLLMATIKKPRLLLLDEHTAALDPIAADKVIKITNDIIRRNNITALMITHNIEQALSYGDKTLMLDKGRIALELDKNERANMSPKDLVDKYTEVMKESITDELLFSATK